MPSIFNSLNIGYTGLAAAQTGISTTSHNISNAESEGYTRQVVRTAASAPISTGSGFIGTGTDIADVKRVFDNFVFDRYRSISSENEFSEFSKKTLEQLSTYFPEIDGVGIKTDLAEYYDMWQTFSDNPDNEAIKVSLAKQTETLAVHITQTQERVKNLQNQVNEELVTNINEVNSLAKELASLNISIDIAETSSGFTANDLRDSRNVIERDLARLIGAEVTVGEITSNVGINSASNTSTGSYTLSVNGLNLVDGSNYHPIHATSANNPSGFYELSYERQDGVLLPLEENLRGGKIGAILDLRGGTIDSTSGVPVDGIIQKTISQLDAFAIGLIESTNYIYAKSSTTKMVSNFIDIEANDPLVSSPLNVKKGSFDIIIYDIDGKESARRKIDIDISTTMKGVADSNSIEGQMLAQKDDNNDSNANNDIDDFLSFNWATYASGDNAVEFTLDPLSKSQGYTFSIEDNLVNDNFSSGTNFAGALGMSRFFDGKDASDIRLNYTLQTNPTQISAGTTPASGNNEVALNMMQHQFEEFVFEVGNTTYETTAYGMFDILVTEIGTATNAAISLSETTSTQYNAIELEYFSTSKVSIDEEMTNLIKYQTSYGAAAKVISTIDQMMQTLLGMKN